MKYLPIVLISFLAIGLYSYAQDAPKPSDKEKDPPTTEIQKDDTNQGGRGFRGNPDMERGRGFRGGRGNPEMEKIRKELFNCPECQAHRKHLQERHGINPWGPRSPLGKFQPSHNNKLQRPVGRGFRGPGNMDEPRRFRDYRNFCYRQPRNCLFGF